MHTHTHTHGEAHPRTYTHRKKKSMSVRLVNSATMWALYMCTSVTQKEAVPLFLSVPLITGTAVGVHSTPHIQHTGHGKVRDA